MAFPELVANSSVPGSVVALTTLNGAINTTPASGVQETWTFVAGPPSALSLPGQFHFVVDSEILLDITGAGGTSRQVLRGQEGSTITTHASGSNVYHYLTAQALLNISVQDAFPAATITVAASNAPARQQAASTYVCTGTADQTVINTAIQALPVAGGLVLLSEGTFSITAPIIFQEDYSALLGLTRGTTIISMASGFVGAAMITCNQDGLGASIRPCQKIEVGNFTVLGNQLGTQSATDGILFKAFRSVLRDVEVYGVNGAGLRVRGVTAAERLAAGGPNVAWTAYGTVVRDCKVHENGNGGIWEDSACTDSGIRNCEIFQNCGPGILDSGGSLNEIAGCYIWQNFDQSVAGGSGLGFGLQFNSGSARTNIVNNKIEQNRGGINFVAGSGFQVIGNVLASNSTSADGTQASSGALPAGWLIAGANNVKSDIEFNGTGGAPDGVLIVGNYVSPQTYSGDESAYAIKIASGTHIVTRHNYLLAGLTGYINNTLGGGNIFSVGENLGYITDAAGTATITSAATSVVVTHGLAYAPEAQSIALTLTNLPTTAIGELYVDTIGSTTFTIRCRTAPGAATAIVGWSVQPHRFS